MEATEVVIFNRPTPAYLAGLFPKHDIAPMQMLYLDPWRGDAGAAARAACGCEIGALLAEAYGGVVPALAFSAVSRHWEMKAEIARVTGLPPAYLEGIDTGFTQGGHDVDDPDAKDPVYKAGVADGVAAYLLVFPSRRLAEGP